VVLLCCFLLPDESAGSASQTPVEQFGEIRIVFEVTAVDGTGNGAGAAPAAGSRPLNLS
ncbi:Uncharacterized protein DAT39_011297, partial [Clarias magur]